MKRAVTALVFLGLTCCVSSQALALGEEHFGNAPLHEANYRPYKGVMPLVNHRSRVYHTWVNGNEHFYYQGDTATLNEALQKFAATESDVHEIVLRPGPGVVHSFNRANSVPFNWNLHIMGGIAGALATLDKATGVWSKHPVLTVYVGGEIDLDNIKIPDRVTVIELSDLKQRCLRGLESTDKTVRGWGAGVFARLDPYDDESMAAIAKLLSDEETWVRLNAAGALTVFGKKAEAVIPALETCLATEDERLKTRIQETIEKIRQAEGASAKEAEHQKLLKRISEFRSSSTPRKDAADAEGTASDSPAGAGQAALVGPIDVAASPDGKTLYVAGADARQLLVVDAVGGKVLRSITVPAEPTGLVLSPDGATLYVTCAAPQGTVAVVDVASGSVRKTLPVGHWPVGPALSPDGKTLYVCNRFDNNVSVIDLPSNKAALVPTSREPYAAACTPDGKSVFVINHLPIDPADSCEVAAVVTVIDVATNRSESIRLPNGSTVTRGVCVSPDGKYVYVTHILSRYQMPTTQVERGWMNTNALSIIDAREKKLVNTVLLDDVDLGAANPWGVACTDDGKTICVAHAGTHELSIIDAAGLIEKLSGMPAKRSPDRPNVQTAADVPNDLAFLRGLRRRVPLGGDGLTVNGPRSLAVVRSKAIVGAYFSDNLAVVDLESKPGDAEPEKTVSTIALGVTPGMSVERRGEMAFNDATICFQHWQSCATCHPDARDDGLNWDVLADGLGNPKNGRSLVLAHKTPPSMSLGVRASAEEAVRGQLKHQLFAVCPEDDAATIDAYLKALRPVASPYLVEGQLSQAAERGKKLFFDSTVNCAKCHPEPLFTDQQKHDVGSRGQYDRHEAFDTPTLFECWRTAPYMHDGRYPTMKQVFTEGKHGQQDGGLDRLNEQEIDDLVEYVLSL